MDVTVEPATAGEVQLVLRGRLDEDGSTRLRGILTALLNEGRYHTVALNLQDLDGIDLTGIATIGVARRVCGVAGVRMRLAGAPAGPGQPGGAPMSRRHRLTPPTR